MQTECAVLYYHLCLVCLYQVCFTLSHIRYDSPRKKNLLNIKCVFGFSLQLFPELFLTVRRYYHKCTQVFT